jgi:hypothetical protein
MARATKKPRATKVAKRSPAAAPRQSVLRRVDESYSERRFEPKSSPREYISVVLMSLGGVALGVGVYAQFLRDASDETMPWARYSLGVGVLLVLAYLLFGRPEARSLRVGELGLGFEQDGKVQRTRWHEIDRIRLVDDELRLDMRGKPLRVSLLTHGGGARRIVAEANKRIPMRVELDDTDLQRIGEVRAGEGQRMAAEPPQVTQMRCLASDKPLSFEKDVRMCRRCNALYHHTAVPRRCAGCGKKLES